MVNYLRMYSFIRNPFLIYDFAPDPIWISLYTYEENFVFFFISEWYFLMALLDENEYTHLL